MVNLLFYCVCLPTALLITFMTFWRWKSEISFSTLYQFKLMIRSYSSSCRTRDNHKLYFLYHFKDLVMFAQKVQFDNNAQHEHLVFSHSTNSFFLRKMRLFVLCMLNFWKRTIIRRKLANMEHSKSNYFCKQTNSCNSWFVYACLGQLYLSYIIVLSFTKIKEFWYDYQYHAMSSCAICTLNSIINKLF